MTATAVHLRICDVLLHQAAVVGILPQPSPAAGPQPAQLHLLLHHLLCISLG